MTRVEKEKDNSFKRAWMQRISEDWAKLQYSASVLDLAMICCLQNHQEMRLGRKIVDPNVGLLSSILDSRSASHMAMIEKGWVPELKVQHLPLFNISYQTQASIVMVVRLSGCQRGWHMQSMERFRLIWKPPKLGHT